MSQASGDKLTSHGLPILGVGVAYGVAFLINEHALFFTRFADGVNWIYLPSGLRLTLVLVFGWPAAVGIAWSSMIISAGPQVLSSLPSGLQAVVTGLISGFAPWLALLAARRWLHIGEDLAGLRVRSLLTMAVLFAVVSAGLHQVWYGSIQAPQERLLQFAVMALGDLAGTLIVLYLGKWALRALAKRG